MLCWRQVSTDVCQHRLDFAEMELSQPDPDTHQCTSDRSTSLRAELPERHLFVVFLLSSCFVCSGSVSISWVMTLTAAQVPY